jgi:RHH-type proline utilization regulon transcriptional repressor/proline dehydrogenase/delta 1-pyrroline-5-carboxylate dehydrogenase
MSFPLSPAEAVLFEHDVQRLGRELNQQAQTGAPGFLNATFWQEKALNWVMRDGALKTDLFRLVDTLPALVNSGTVARHAREYLLSDERRLPLPIDLGLQATTNPLIAGVSAFVIRQNVRQMARRFIVGGEARSACRVLHRLWQAGFGFTVDLLGEAAVNTVESQVYADRYRDLIDFLPGETLRWPARELLDRGPNGAIPRANISLKLSAMDHLLDPVDVAGSVARLRERVVPLLRRAKEQGAFVNFDLESWSLHEITYRLFEEVAASPEFATWPHLGIVVQAYLKNAGADVDRLLALVDRRGTPITIRLVKGAYWDYEVVLAGLSGVACPVFTRKGQTDANYERLIGRLLHERERLHAAFGTHNLRSIGVALAHAERLGLAPGAFELQMLYGMADAERNAVRDRGHRVRLYAPVGDLITGMAYLVRRLLENTANSSFLRMSHHERVDIGDLLAPPRENDDAPPSAPAADEFRNCPLTDFTDNAAREAFARAVADAGREMPWRVPVVIAGRARTDGPSLDHPTPNARTQIATRAVAATVDDVERAIAVAREAWPAWRDLPLERRAAILRTLGDRLEADRLHLAALQVHEQGKPWREADADVAEAVDFCRYYAQQALVELAPRRQGALAGEINVLGYEGRGLCAVIAPWNFPLAILCGMTTAALVAGNAVLMKPAEQSTAVAHALHRHALAAGVPAGVLAFLPGVGELVGNALVRHRDVVQIAFTGSREVGTAILRAAAELAPGQVTLKRVVCEMGGKNAIIVDDDADLDEAITGVIRSAFGYAGQKCSACSRLIVVGAVYDTLVERLRLAVAALVPDSAVEPGCLLPPVIDETAHRRLLDVIANPGDGVREIYRGTAGDAGWFVAPAIFAVTDPLHPLMQREFFGPVLALFAARDFDHALEVANTSDYALTGAVYSRSPAHLDEARRRFRVGNLYLNRPCTGAMVHRQPFGGFKLSGAGTKAGGPGYLLHFTEMRVCTENTMRHGFTPEIAP